MAGLPVHPLAGSLIRTGSCHIKEVGKAGSAPFQSLHMEGRSRGEAFEKA